VSYLLCALLVLVGLAPLARAGDGDGGKARKGFDFGGGKGHKPTGTDKKPDAAPEAGPKSAPTDPTQALVQELASWPDRRGKHAAEKLFLLGSQAVPYLVQVLARDDDDAQAVQAGAAWVLGKIGEPAHVQVILRAAAQRPNASRADVFFRAAYELDGRKTRDWLIGFLALSTKPVFRTKAAEYLATKVGPADRDRVLELLDSDKPQVRIAGLTLLAPAHVEDADERFLQALSDLNPEVAHAATRLLAGQATDDMVRRLNTTAREGGARERAYAVLALVEIARAQGTNPFEEATIHDLAGRRGLLHPEELPAAAAAVGLAYGALDSRDEAIANLLDGRVVDTLIRTLGGPHFRDYNSVAPNALAALRRLSGLNLADTAVAWARWWRGARGSFRARRPLRSLDPADEPRAYVLFDAVEANGRRHRAEFVCEGGAERPHAFLLHRRVFEGLVSFLQGEGLFDADGRGGLRSNEHVAVTLGVLNQRKRMTVSADPVGGTAPRREAARARYERLRMRMQALVAANVWQLYRDADKWPDPTAWWKANVDVFAQASPDERKAMLQAGIVYAYDDLQDDTARAEALQRLRDLGGPISETEARVLARDLAGGTSFGQMEADGLRWIIEQGHPQARAEMMDALAKRQEPEARDILARLLLEGGVERLRSAFADPRPALRAAAAHAARLWAESDATRALPPEQRVAQAGRLRPGLQVLALDKDVHVSVLALLALAYLGDTNVVDKLEQLYEGGDFHVKLEVTRALGYVPGAAAHPLLTRVMAEERGDAQSAALRAAALEAMARSGHKDAVRLLRFYLLNDRDPTVRDTAGRVLAEMGTDEARFAIVEHLHGGEPDPQRRARCVDVLGRFDGTVVPVMLRRYLGDPDDRVRAVAALRAADHNMAEAFPFLLQILRKGTGAQRDAARTAMENLTSMRFAESGYTALARRYEQWYEDPRIKGLSDRAWFREALKRKGYDPGPLASYLEGKQDLTGVPLLLRVLRDDDPVIRRNAAVALARLTGHSFGKVKRSTSAAEAARIADRWAAWLKTQGAGPKPGR
jgi:HEAT repeat protein